MGFDTEIVLGGASILSRPYLVTKSWWIVRTFLRRRVMNGATFSNGQTAKTFMLAGNARVTLVSGKTGARFTFRVSSPKDGAPHFVSLLSGPNNDSDYQFLGTIFNGDKYYRGAKSHIGSDAPSAKAFAWAWSFLSKGQLPPGCEVCHEGRCARCGRSLTVPESVASGLGPECARKGG